MGPVLSGTEALDEIRQFRAAVLDVIVSLGVPKGLRKGYREGPSPLPLISSSDLPQRVSRGFRGLHTRALGEKQDNIWLVFLGFWLKGWGPGSLPGTALIFPQRTGTRLRAQNSTGKGAGQTLSL